MDNGLSLFLTLAVLIISWLAVDLSVFLLGKETASQWIIKIAKRDKVFGWCMLAVVVLVAAVLIVHWELLEILL